MISLASSQAIGLDIGTSAVRAAQVSSGRGQPRLVSFGQAALQAGAVADGEIQDSGAVAEAISSLWKRAKLRSKKVVIGVANQRVVVRQIELPYLEEKDFKSSLRFQVADHIPMPVEAAELDYQIIDDYDNAEGRHMMRVLVVAAATDMVESFIATVAAAGLQTVGVDLSPFAVARALSPVARGEVGAAGAEAVVDIGATVTSIVVHHNGEPRFVRILSLGGEETTAALMEKLGVSFEAAEAAKFDIEAGAAHPEAEQVILSHLGALVREIRGSLDYYLAQEGSEPIASVVLAGGGSLTPGLLPRLQEALELNVTPGAALSDLDVAKSKLTDEQVALIEPVSAAAVGLARGTRAA